MISHRIRRSFATFSWKQGGENPTTRYFVGKVTSFGQIDQVFNVFNKITHFLRLFALNWIV